MIKENFMNIRMRNFESYEHGIVHNDESTII